MGGQSIAKFDYDLAPYVAKTYVKQMCKILDIEEVMNPEEIELFKTQVFEYLKDNPHILTDNGIEFINSKLKEAIGYVQSELDTLHNKTLKYTNKETYQSMEAFVHNMNTLNCLPGHEKIWVKNKRSNRVYLTRLDALEGIFKTDEYQAISLNMETNEVEYKDILAIERKDNHRRLVNFTTKFGQKVSVTDNHKVLTLDYTNMNKTVKELPEEVYQLLTPRSLSLPEIINSKITYKINGESTSINMTPELAHLLGFYLSLGKFSRKRIEGDNFVPYIRFYKCYYFDSHKITNLIKTCFNLDNAGQDDNKFFLPEGILEVFTNFFLLGDIPDSIMFGSEEIRKSFIRALFISGVRKNKPYFDVRQLNHHMMYQIRFLLLTLGIPCNAVEVKFKNYSNYRITIAKEDFYKLDLGFIIESNDWMNPKESIEYSKNPFEIELSKIRHEYNISEEQIKSLNNYTDIENLINNNSIKNKVLDKLLNIYAVKETYTITEDNGNEYVYDIAVQDNENFMTADGIFVSNSRAGSQVPFSSINYGTDTSDEGRMLVKNLLYALDAGLGNGETPIFPIHVFKVKDGVNGEPDDPNYDLLKLACKVSSKRLFPNFTFIDAPFNLKYYREGRPETENSTMGCLNYDHKIIIKNWKNSTSYTDNVANTNNIQIIEIGKFFENYNSYINESGLTLYKSLEGKPDKVYVFDSKNNKYSEIKKIIKNPDMGNWMNIKVEGRSEPIICTEDHPFQAYCQSTGLDQVVRIFAKNLTTNDYLISSEGNKLEIKSIQKLGYLGNCSYDLETESDTFDFDGIRSHNCRTRVVGNIHDPDNEIFTGRGNLSFTSINLPRLALKSKKNIDNFFERLDSTIDLVFDQLMDRFEVQAKKKCKNLPFLMGQHVYLDSEKLGPEDEIREVIKHGSITIGFIGLAECLVALIGKHHGESEEAQQLGLKIIGHMRKRCDDKAEETKLNFSLISTPAEGLCLHSNTLVQTITGSKKIKDIKKGDYVFTFNEKTHKIEIDKVMKAGMTFKSKKVMKVTFDTGQSIICTPNHPFAVRVLNKDDSGKICPHKYTGSRETIQWVEARDLEVGNRIRSNYIEKSPTGYLRFKNQGKDGYIHRMVYEYFSGNKIADDCVVHHIDENKENNSYENLEYMSKSEHKKHHLKDTIGKYCYTSESVKGEKNPFYGKQHSDESKRKISETKRSQGRFFGDPNVPIEVFANLYYEGNSIQKIADKYGYTFFTMRNRLLEAGVEFRHNHIVTKIEYLDKPVPVYDLTMKKNHNFFVGGDRGILVHNSGRFINIDKKEFGIIPGVTDRAYYTNSNHVPVYYPISISRKIDIEAPYHEFTNGGHIAYVEVDGDISKNPEAFEQIVQYMKKAGVGYGSINHPVDRDPVCGYTGIINDCCPRCGRHEGEGITREKLAECLANHQEYRVNDEIAEEDDKLINSFE